MSKIENVSELRLDNTDLILKDNRVNSEILPRKSSELDRSVIIEGNVEINGAVYGKRIIVHTGPVEFKRAAFASAEFLVEPTSKGELVFHEQVGSSSVVSATPLSSKVIFASDINSKRVNLRNAFVGGSIYADEIILDHCVVIGGVFASKKITMNSSVVGTFNSQAVELDGICYLIYPSAFSVEPLASTKSAKLYNITLCDLMDAFKGNKQKEGTGKIDMDIDKMPQRVNLKDEDGTILLVHSYSVAAKVLSFDIEDFKKLNNHFLINAASLSGKLLKDYEVEADDGKKRNLDLDEISSFFFSILSGDLVIPDVKGSINFEELKERMKDSNT